MSSFFKTAIENVINKKDLSLSEAEYLMSIIMEGVLCPVQIAALLIALRMKGESANEIAGFASVMRKKTRTIEVSSDSLVDTCGTGGDKLNTFNISTIAAFVVAGAGIKVAKHGNRSVSSKCGSADVLEYLGAKIDADAFCVKKCIEEVGIAFFFAPLWHPAMKYAVEPRKALGIRTVFNLLGPMTNPAKAKNQIMGVFDKKMGETIAQAMIQLGMRRVFIVHGDDGMDEITLTGKSHITEVNDDAIITWEFDPREYGFNYVDIEALKSNSIENNAKIFFNVLQGEKSPSRDIVVLNAAFAILASNTVADIEEAIQKASKSINDGAAKKKLDAFINLTNSN